MEEEDVEFSKAYLRVERQNLNSLPKTGAIMFCVCSYLTPLKQIWMESDGPELADTIESMPEKLGLYKARPFWGRKVCEFLREAAW